MTLRQFDLPRPYFGVSRRGEAAQGQGAGRQARAPRRLITGVALTAQKCRLLLQGADGQIVYACRVLDVANGGYCITLLGMERLVLIEGQHAILEQTDKTLTPVELRWCKGNKMGLKRLPRRM